MPFLWKLISALNITTLFHREKAQYVLKNPLFNIRGTNFLNEESIIIIISYLVKLSQFEQKPFHTKTFSHQITSGDTVYVGGHSAPTHLLSMSDFFERHMTVNMKNMT